MVPLLQRCKISPVLGYLLCGIVIGPHGIASWVQGPQWIRHISIDDPETVHALGELGIIALMFMIGLELSLERLKDLRRYIFGLGASQILLTAVSIVIIASMFGNTMPAAILLGVSFALSSTAIVMKLLEERGLTHEPVGVLCFSVLLMQDLAVVPLLVLASSLGGGESGNVIVSIAISLLIGCCAVLAIYWLGKKVIAPLLQSLSLSGNPEWLPACVVFVVIGCSALTYSVGLSFALGAFMVGLLIAETEFRQEVEEVLNPLKSLLLGIFFLSIGMMVNLMEVLRHPVLLLVAVLGIYSLKAIIIFPLCRLFGVGGKEAAEASVYLAPPGEFALLILGAGMVSGIMPVEDVQFFLLTTVLAMMLSPLLFRLAATAGRYGHRLFPASAGASN